MTDSHLVVQPEHPSLEGYLVNVLTREQRERVLIVAFNQWSIATAAVGEIAAALHTMGTEPIVALWADDTPLHDVGWSTSRLLARLLRSPSRDDRVRQGLEACGVPRSAFPRPPLRRWKPVEPLPVPTTLSRSSIRELRYRGAPLGRAILQVHPDKDTPVTDAHEWPRKWVEACIRSYAFAFDQAAALIAQRRATAAVVYNGRFLHDSAVAGAAAQAGIPVLSFDSGGLDTDFDLTIDATHDWSALQGRMRAMYQSWDSNERDAIGASWFEDRRSHADPLNSLFVATQVIGKGVEAPRDRRLVVYFSSSGDEISELDLDWGDYFHGQPGALGALAEVCRSRSDTTLVVRTHPHKRVKPRRDVEEWHEAVEAAAPDVHLDEHADVDSYTLMRQADVVATYGSTTGVEAAYAGRPVIVMGPSAYDELGCATRVMDQSGIRRFLDEPCAGDVSGAIAYGLMMRRRGFNFHHVTRRDGVQMLGGVPIIDSHEVILKLSHLWNRTSVERLIQR